jgi:hypothetical protein
MHALPIKRSMLLFSGLAAIFVWRLIIMAVPTVLALISLLSENTDFFQFAYAHFASDIYMIGTALVAISATGIKFSAYLNTFIIAFVPGILSSLFASSLYDSVPVLVNDAPGITSFFNSPDDIILLAHNGNELMYIILGVIYLALGSFLFIKRKSETASKNAPNRFLRTVYSTLAGLLLCLIPISLIMEGDKENILIPVFYMLAIVACLGYEFFTSKRVTELKHAVLSIGIIALINVLLISSFNLTVSYHKTKSYDIVGFQLIDHNETAWGKYETTIKAYGTVLADRHYITDTDACDKLEDIYDRTLEIVNTKKHQQFNANDEKMYFVTFKLLDKNGRTYYRRIYVSDSERNILAVGPLSRDEEFLRLLSEVPKPKTVTGLRIHKIESPSKALDAKLYDTLYEELSSLPQDQRLSLLRNAPSILAKDYHSKGLSPHPFKSYAYVSVEGNINGEHYVTDICLNPKYLPKSHELYVRYF